MVVKNGIEAEHCVSCPPAYKAKNRKILVQIQYGQILLKTLFQKYCIQKRDG
jgi:hypothetical protein